MKLSIIYMLDNEDYKKSLHKLLDKHYSDVEIFVINRILSKKALDELKSIEPTIQILDGNRKSFKECLESVWKKLNAEFVYITTASCIMDKKTIPVILKQIKANPNASFYFFNSFFARKKQLKHYPNFNSNDILYINLYSYVFPKKAIRDFNEITDVCDSETQVQLLLQLFSHQKNLILIDEVTQQYTTRLSLNHDCYNKKWYTDTIQNIYLPYLNCHTSNNWQERILYCSIFYKFKMNENGSNKEVLLGDERQGFFEAVGELFRHFSPDFFNHLDFLDARLDHNYAFKYFMIFLREGIEKLTASFEEEKIITYINSHKVPFCNDVIEMEAMNYYDKKLVIDASFDSTQIIDLPTSSIYALVDGEKKSVTKLDIYSLTKYFAVSTQKKYVFQLSIPCDGLKHEIEIILNLNGVEKRMPLNFHKAGARLTEIYPHTYWQYKDILVKYRDNKLIITKNRAFSHLTNEILFCIDLLLYSHGFFRLKNFFLRALYWILKPFYAHKRIWLYFDKLYKADDNGEFAITYTSKLKDGIDHYYVINASSYDLPRLNGLGIKTIKFNSLRHKLMSLYAENIVATHPDIIKFCGFGKNLQLAFRNLWNANIICIAHGLTMQKNAEVQNRLYDNTMFYTTSSKYEVNHLLEPVYGYSPDQIALTGMSRFDVMISNDQKEILITPTWRRSVSGVSNFNSPKEYNSEFKSSSYYKIYNSLINDKRLIQCAKKTGYKLVFLLHPAMSSQIDDYDKNEYVTFLQATSDISYHDILSKSSLMVTDYSGVQYDFAYMHKPIIYYHSELLPPRFEEGALKYDTMGFGPICKDHESIVSELIKYMKNNCQIEKKYEDRINDFFAFNDRNNSKRIYEAILEFTDRMKK